MAITKYTSDIELKPGMYVNLDSLYREGFAGQPALIKKVTAASIVVTEMRTQRHFKTGEITTEDGVDSTRRKSSISWVCDTLEEAQLMLLASSDHVYKTMDLLKELKAKAIAEATGEKPDTKSSMTP